MATVGSVAAVILLAAGCGSSENGARNANSVQPAGAGKALGGAYDTGYGAGGYGAGGAAPAAGSGSGSDVGSGAGKGEPAGQLAVRDIESVGSVVTDSAGMALYRFDKDTPKPPKSNCEGDCAMTWPAVPADDASAAAGIDASLLGSVARADGSKQLTLAGWPVYRYAKDTKAGEAKGEGVGGTWHALAPDGKKAVDKKQKADGNGGMAGMEMKSGAELSVADNEKLGKILVDGQWRTLYRFDKDSAWPMKFGCLGACLDTWKPAPAVDKSKAEGISGKLVGSVKRPDGSEQLTIDCWPVYTFTGDTEPGQANGHNKQGLWFAVTAEGKKVPPTA
ncbi:MULTISPECIES: SCO0930 family lipoprotein [unclassified Streptomyces]|uniref:SCO0930 family lipoprotein n=1 Tax=unclassified Streptomyces TaxID=2593676 RepID=UPI002E0D4456|nr:MULTISPECIES: SCO0930 family lipoprotein [unclassified Streptomyces]WSR22286.1 SCO0930 family lipoprotein [Streptomyces sp. NBC_01205]